MADLATTTPSTNGNPNAGMLQDWYQSYLRSNPTANTATAQTTNWAPDANSTVQGQLAKVTDAGGPLMQRAETKALQGMNSRGLLNSSIAVGAGQSALYDAAMPIATQDANTFASAGKSNADAANANAQFNANTLNTATNNQIQAGVSGAQQQAGFTQQTVLQDKDFAQQTKTQAADLANRNTLADKDIANQQALQQANATLQTNLATQSQDVQQSMQKYQLSVQQAMQGVDNATKMQLQQLDAATQTSLADLNNRYRVQLQSSQSVAATYQSLTDSISRVMVDPNMDAPAKQSAINNLTTMYQGQMALQSKISGLDLGSILNPGDAQAPAAPAPTPAPANQGGMLNTIGPSNDVIRDGGN